MLLRITILLLALLTINPSATAAVVAPVHPVTETVLIPERHELEEQLGRKLKFKERVALGIARGKQKRALKRQARGLEPDPEKKPRKNSLAFFSLLSSFVGFFFFGILLGTLGITLGVLALIRAEKEGLRGKGLAIAGLVLGAVSLIGAVIVISAMVAAV